MQLHEALAQISHMREQMARSEVFRGYRALTVGFSGVLALLAAAVQPLLIPRPPENIGGYLSLWVATAALSIVAAGIEMALRARASQTTLTRQMTRLAIEQFMPSLVVGAVLTIVLIARAPDAVWLLPGLWALIFSLGIFASYRLLPRHVFWVGVYYLMCGVLCLQMGSGEAALRPWLMGLTFGVGQLFAAAVLYLTLERSHAGKS